MWLDPTSTAVRVPPSFDEKGLEAHLETRCKSLRAEVEALRFDLKSQAFLVRRLEAEGEGEASRPLLKARLQRMRLEEALTGLERELAHAEARVEAHRETVLRDEKLSRLVHLAEHAALTLSCLREAPGEAAPLVKQLSHLRKRFVEHAAELAPGLVALLDTGNQSENYQRSRTRRQMRTAANAHKPR